MFKVLYFFYIYIVTAFLIIYLFTKQKRIICLETSRNNTIIHFHYSHKYLKHRRFRELLSKEPSKRKLIIVEDLKVKKMFLGKN